MAWSPNPHLSPYASGEPDDSLQMIKEETLSFVNHQLPKKYKSSRDPTSHRIIEKRRRDRMNNCLADLSRMIPSTYMKHGQSRIEKTEIVELAIRFIINLNSQLKRSQILLGHQFPNEKASCCRGQYYLGYSGCTNEAVRYLVESEGFSSNDTLCAKLRSHLQTCAQKHIPDLTDSSNSLEGTSGCPGPPSKIITGALKSVSQSSNSEFSVNMDSGPGQSISGPSRSCSDSGAMALAPSKSPVASFSCRRSVDFMTADDSRPEAEVDFTNDGMAMETNAASSRDEVASETDSVSANQPSTCSSRDIYKFKNDIKLRFKADMSSQTSSSRTSIGTGGDARGELQCQPTSDASSSSSREEEGSGRRLKSGNGAASTPSGASDSNGSGSAHSSSASSAYPNSSETSGHGSSVSSSCLVVDQSPSKTGPGPPRFCPPRGESLLPGFALHISGTHYVPIVVCPGQIEPPMTEENGALPGIYHPISIPVNFGAARFIRSVKMEGSD